MKTLLSFLLLFFGMTLSAQDVCTDALSVEPTANQLTLNRDLIHNIDGTFTIVKENLTLLNAKAMVEELEASLQQTGTESARGAAIRTVLGCMIDNELLD